MPKDSFVVWFASKLLAELLGVGACILVLFIAVKSMPSVPHDWHDVWVTLPLVVVLVVLTAYTFWAAERSREAQEKAQAVRIEKAESKAEAEPEKAKFAWDVARVKLEAYFDRNLSQVNQIFWAALIVMFIGFVFILWAVWLSIGQPKITPTSLVASSAGIISQFIGATFMLIYRSTISQANSFMSVLERINTVGMSIQVLDSIPEGELKNKTRAQMIDQLLNANVHFTPSASKANKKAADAEE